MAQVSLLGMRYRGKNKDRIPALISMSFVTFNTQKIYPQLTSHKTAELTLSNFKMYYKK